MLRLPMLLLAFFLAGMAAAQSKTYYVSPTGTGDGSSWDKATTLSDALTAARAGDKIWVKGFETVNSADSLYKGSFTVKSGVQLYGGFAGTETKLTDRETLGKPYQLKYRSVLSGDLQNNDKVDNVNLIFPANTTRSDNAPPCADAEYGADTDFGQQQYVPHGGQRLHDYRRPGRRNR